MQVQTHGILRTRVHNGAHIQNQGPTGLKQVFGCTTVHANKTKGRRAWDLGVWVWVWGREEIPEGWGCCPDNTNTVVLEFSFIK